MHVSAKFWAVFAVIGVMAVGPCRKEPGRAEFERGVYELRRNNFVRARALLEKAIARRPGSEQNAEAYNYLGIAAWRLGHFRAAEEAFESARRLDPSFAEPVYNLALLHRQRGEIQQAIQLLEQAARVDKSDPRPLEILGAIYMEQKQWPRARRALHAALNRAPNSARILTSLAIVDLESVGPERSIESHLIALEKDARYPPALFNLGLIYLTRLGDPDRAGVYFRRYLALKPTGPTADFAARAVAEPAAMLPTAPPPAPPPLQPPVASAGPSTTTLPNPVATAVVSQAATPAPRTPAARDDEIIREANLRAERGDAGAAVEMLLQAADVARLEGRKPAQERLLKEAARIGLDDARGHLALAQFLLAERRYADALRSYRQASVLDPRSLEAHLGIARAALATGEHDAALIGYQQAVRLDPRNADALWEMAELLDRRLNLQERALSTYREFEKLFPGDPRAPRAAERIRALAASVRSATQTARIDPPAITPPPPTPIPSRPPPPQTSPSPPSAPGSTLTPRPTLAADPYFGREPTPPARRIAIRPAANRNPNIAVASFNEGVELLRQRRWEQAASAFLRALEHNPQMDLAFYNLGLAYSQMGDYELAKDAYLQTLAIKPNHVQARYNLALLYFQTRDLPSAAALASDLARREPNYAVVHYLLGQIYSERPETLPQARAAYARFLELEPNHPAAAVVRQWLATN